MTAVYLDYNATAPMKPAVKAAVLAALDLTGNPSSVHAFGRAARRAVEKARGDVAALVSAAPGDVVFTSGATEANNMALRGVCGRVLVSAIEHPSALAAVGEAEQIPVTPAGIVDLAALEALLASRPAALVSIMLVNSETGLIQPVAEAARLAKACGALMHCDATQAVGRIPVDMVALGLDLLTFSSHKIAGPPGAGALVVRPGLEVAPLLRGGAQESRRRAGTENVPAILGFGAAAALAASDLEAFAGLAMLRDGMEARLRQIASDLAILGEGGPRVANTSLVALPGLAAETQLMALDLAGIAVSTGSACSSGTVKPSHVLKAMGVADGIARSAIRVSLGWASEPGHIDRFVGAWTALYNRAGTGGRAAA
jgi:cysteine desulfurase